MLDFLTVIYLGKGEKMKAERRTKHMIYIALFAVIIAVCSWISIPSFIPFTLQSFAIVCALLLLGGKSGTFAVFMYILIGVLGLPVFSSFTGGIGVLIGPNGGYIIGFLLMALVYWSITYLFKNKMATKVVAIVAGMLVCYVTGTLQYVLISAPEAGIVGFVSALSLCVLPFIVPDAVKISLAFLLSNRLNKHIKL